MRLSGLRSNINRVLAVGCLACLAMGSALADVKWQTSYAEAFKLAAQSNKPVFVDFYAEWCGPCKALEKDVFSDPRVKELLNKTICLRLDIDQHEAEARKFSVISIPRLMLFSPDGKGVLWDTMGYREADEFVQEFSEALHVKAPIATVAPEIVPIEPPALVKLRAALATPGGLSKLQSIDPASAKEGLRLLVAQLAVFKEEDFKPTAKLLQAAGPSALPALQAGMESKTLATRVGAYKILLSILGKSASRYPTFDPWGRSSVRAAQLAAWRKALGSKGLS